MLSRADRIAKATSLLVPYAVPHAGTLGRVLPEEPDPTRFPFQRDRDRIIHSQAFRRLQGKTQVFVAGEGDHYRTRLTHTLEVAQISRDIARTMQLNEDLAECIALAHDLGHPPFGHTGEEALDAWMKTQSSHFEHNEQSYRLVTVLEEYSSQQSGLNVNQEVLAGLLKHQTPYDHPTTNIRLVPSLEAQLVNIADEVAYTGHDCDDALRAGLFSLSELRTVPLIEDAYQHTVPRGTRIRSALISLLVTDLYDTSDALLREAHIHSLDYVYRATAPLIDFSVRMKRQIKELRAFLWTHMYLHPKVREPADAGKTIIKALCEGYFAHPPQKILDLQERTGSPLRDAVKDYVAGMTDEFAQKNYDSL